MNKMLILENNQGEVLRVFNTGHAKTGHIIYRQDKKRIEVVHDLDQLQEQKVKFNHIKTLEFSEPIEEKITDIGTFKLVDRVGSTIENVHTNDEHDHRMLWNSLAIVSTLAILVMSFLISLPEEVPSLEEELKQHVVKIIKRAPKIEKQNINVAQISKRKVTETKKVTKSVRRMGALAVLGRLNRKNKQYGGLNLGAVKTSPGPGLGGGTQGSGGIQKSLYGKGIVAAPVGPGANIRGAGGYGTKGKGGGQDGYGKMSLIGSTGTASIPLGKEAIIHGGLDQDLINSVIQKNMGQIRFCYEQGLQTNPKLRGRVAVNFTISGNGRVSLAGLKSTTLHSKIVEDCILLRLKTWKFPLPEGGLEVKVSYPFLLRRLGSG